MQRLQKVLKTNCVPRKRAPKMFSMVQLHSHTNSHTNSNNSLSCKRYKMGQKLKKANCCSTSNINDQIPSTITQYRQKNMRQRAVRKLDKNLEQSQQLSKNNTKSNSKLLEIEIQNYHHLSNIKNNKNNKSIIRNIKNRAYTSIDNSSPLKTQINKPKNYHRINNNKRSITQRSCLIKSETNILKGQLNFKSIQSISYHKQKNNLAVKKKQGKREIKLRKSKKSGSSAVLRSRRPSYEFYQTIITDQKKQQDLTIKKQCNDIVKKQANITKKICSQKALFFRKQNKEYQQFKQQKQYKKSIETEQQKINPKNKLKRRMLTEIQPTQESDNQNKTNPKFQSYLQFINSYKRTSKKIQKDIQKVNQKQNNNENQQILSKSRSKYCGLPDFSSILEINQSSFLSDAGRKILNVCDNEDDFIKNKQSLNFITINHSDNKPAEKLSKQSPQSYKNNKKQENCLQQKKLKKKTQKIIENTKSHKKKQKQEYKNRYFDENLEAINLDIYRSIPVSSINNLHTNHSKKNIIRKNVIGKLRKAFPKGFFQVQNDQV